MIGSDNNKFPVKDILKVGQDNAISRDDLATLFNCSVRDISSEIEWERNHGAIIVSGSGKGYWLPSDISDIEIFIKVQEGRIKALRSILKGAKAYIKAYKEEGI